jgi:uncharacterized protein (TIGR03435 family)
MRTNLTRAQRTSPVRSESRELLAVGIFGHNSLGDRIETLLQRGRDFSPRASIARVAVSVVVLLAFVGVGSRAPRWIAFAQQEPKLAFEVASIKPGNSGDERSGFYLQPGGRLTASNVSLKRLISYAYDVRDHQIAKGPTWLDVDAFTVEAKPDSAFTLPRGPLPPGPPSPAQSAPSRRMMQSLLADRFQLAVHRESRELPVFELALAKGGSKLKSAAARQGLPDGLLHGGRGQVEGIAVPMWVVTFMLTQEVGRSVIDKTGLGGHYDFELKWTPETARRESPDALPELPSLFTALQEQLGLRLESAKGPVEIIVVDRAEKPDAN